MLCLLEFYHVIFMTRCCSFNFGGAFMAHDHKITNGPGFFDLIQSLTVGKSVRFTTSPYAQEKEIWGWEVVLFSWDLIGGCHEDRKITIAGNVIAHKEPCNLNFRPIYLKFEAWYDARKTKGEMTIAFPYPLEQES